MCERDKERERETEREREDGGVKTQPKMAGHHMLGDTLHFFL